MKSLSLYHTRFAAINDVPSRVQASLHPPRFLWIASLHHPRFSVDSLVISPTSTSLYHPHFQPAKPLLSRVPESVTRARLLTLSKSLTCKRAGHPSGSPTFGGSPSDKRACGRLFVWRSQAPASILTGQRCTNHSTATPWVAPTYYLRLHGNGGKGKLMASTSRITSTKSQKRFGRSGGVWPISESPERAVQIGRQPMRASAKSESRTPCRPLSAVQVSIGNFFLGNFRRPFGCEPFSSLVSTLLPCRPHPACSELGNSEACPCRNSGQIKVASPRAAHLNLSPRCGDLAGEPSLSSHIDALVPAALRSEVWLCWTVCNRQVQVPILISNSSCAEQLPCKDEELEANTTREV